MLKTGLTDNTLNSPFMVKRDYTIGEDVSEGKREKTRRTDGAYLAHGLQGILSGDNTVVEPRRLFPVIVVGLNHIPLLGSVQLPDVSGIMSVPADDGALTGFGTSEDVVYIGDELGVAQVV